MDSIATDMKAETMRGISNAQQQKLAEWLSLMKQNLIRLDAVGSRDAVDG
jgi:hypothetical protein